MSLEVDNLPINIRKMFNIFIIYLKSVMMCVAVEPGSSEITMLLPLLAANCYQA